MSEDQMDWLPLLRAWFPNFDDQERRDVLWNCTAYPCAGYEHVKGQLQALRDKAIRGATADELIGEAERELEGAMDAAREQGE